MPTSQSNNTPRRVGLGFSGGQTLSLRMLDRPLADLRTAIQSQNDQFFETEAIDGAVLIDLRQVAYLRVDSDDQRVGF